MNVINHLFGWIQRHQGLTLLVMLIVTLACLTGLPKLRIDTGFQSLVPAYDPARQVYQRVAKEFGSDNRNLVYVADQQLWQPERLQAFTELHRALEQLPFVSRVDSLVNLRTIRGDGVSVQTLDLLSDIPDDEQAIAAIRDEALYNPLIKGQFIAEDGLAMTLLVLIDDLDTTSDPGLNSALDEVLSQFDGRFERLFQLGSSRINAELKTSLFDDLVLLGPLSVLILVVVLLLFVRSVTTALVPLLTSALSLTWTLGLMGWLGIPVNLLTAMLPSLVIVIGSTEDTHLVVSYFRGLQQHPQRSRQFAVNFMLRQVGIPMLLTVLTTSLGFASNLFSGIGLIRDFALASTIAILANGLITLVLVPLLLRRFGPRRSLFDQDREHPGGLPGLVFRLFDAGNRRFSRSILTLTTLLCVFFVYQAASLFVTNDPLSYFRADRQLIRDVETLHERLAGMKTFFIALESEQEKAFQYPNNIRRLGDIQQFMLRQGIFDNSISMADHLALVNREFHGGNPQAYEVPRSREQVAQFLLFFHRNDLSSYVSHDYRRANIVVRHNVTDSRTLNQHIAELQQVVDKLSGPEIRGFVVGENLMINRAADTLMTGQVKSLGVLLLVIFLLMSMMFTSFKGGLIALVPSLIPIILMFGVMGLFDISLNPGTAMVAVIAIGIAVDGTIHLFSRYNALCRHTSDNAQAVRETVEHEAVPLVATSLSLAVGFGVLLFSNFTVIAQFGAMSALTMLFAIYANLLVTPIIMSRVRLVGLYEILMMRMNKAQLLGSPLFQGMSDYQVRKAILISEYQDYQADDMIIRAGAHGRSMFLLLSGDVAIVRDGAEVTRLKVGEVFGEIGFVRETLRTADVRALNEVQVLRFDYQRLQKDLKYFPNIVAKLNFNISRILGERLAEVIERNRKH